MITKSSTATFSHENLVEKFKIFGQDFVPIRTALRDLTDPMAVDGIPCVDPVAESERNSVSVDNN